MRFDAYKTLPEGYKAMKQLQAVVDQSQLDHKLLELIKIRASQLNGCAYCLDMHTKDAIAIGEDPQRIYVLNAWYEAPFYSDEERAALAWCEALTLVSELGAPDEIYEDLEKHFSKKQIMSLTFAIIAINSWNRIAISVNQDVGGYESPL